MSLLDLYVVQYKVLENCVSEKNDVTPFLDKNHIGKNTLYSINSTVKKKGNADNNYSNIRYSAFALNDFLNDGVIIGRYESEESFNKIRVFCDKSVGVFKNQGILKINSIGDLVFTDTSKNGSSVLDNKNNHSYLLSSNEFVLFPKNYKNKKIGVASVSFGNKMLFFQGMLFLFSKNTSNYNYTLEVSLEPKNI